MTVLDARVEGGGRTRPGPRPADATTILALFVALQFVLPSRLVLNYLPLSLSPASGVALFLGALWLCTQMTTTLGAAKGRSPVRTMLFAYVVVLVASYASSAMSYLDPDERELADTTLVRVFALILVGVAAVDGIRSLGRLYFLLRVAVVCATLVAVFGILQYLAGFDVTPYLRLPGLHFWEQTNSVGARNGLTRAAGTTSNPLEFGVLCSMILPLAIHATLHARREARRVAPWAACVGLLATGLMFSVSRSAIIGVAAATFVLFLGWPARRRLWMIATGVGFVAAIGIMAPGLLNTFRTLFQDAGQDSSVQWRLHDYDTARQLIAQHFWLGRGTGTWYAPKHEIFDNQYLLTLVESGLLGLVAFVGIFVAGLYAAVRVRFLWSRGPAAGTHDRDLALALAASLSVVFPSFATFDFLAFPTVSATAFLLAGIAGALLRVAKAEAVGEPADPHALV
ncbi:O-antigen ligase family protein [Nocardioides halotolerans]|uniref:O-antigen ligase family protein n=1 Tax=Nocardioides halotolerans TaxID=433660 RepID=UPI0004169B05|nr:O-antigen ligase family protein [Nocardioides halotolerans]